jgi:hypothetical protein
LTIVSAFPTKDVTYGPMPLFLFSTPNRISLSIWIVFNCLLVLFNLRVFFFFSLCIQKYIKIIKYFLIKVTTIDFQDLTLNF